MDPLLVLIGMTFAGATVLSILYVHQRLTAPGHLARLRVAPGRRGDLQLRSPLLSSRGSRIPLADRLPLSTVARERTELELERAAVPLRVSEYVALRVLFAALGSVAGMLVLDGLGGPIPLVAGGAVLAMLVGWLLPPWWLASQRSRRLAAFEAQLPAALVALAKSLRAGTGLLQALDFTAAQSEAPLRDEFQLTLRQLRLGANPEDAFAALAARVGSPDLDIAVTGIVIQRNVGGNLSEILSNVARTITERELLHREVNVLTSRQKLTGNLVAAVPVLVAVAFLGLNAELGALLLGTTAGRVALALGIAFEVIGLFFIRRLARVEV
jgi:tight adherence protein B